jgi:hypothetical protein
MIMGASLVAGPAYAQSTTSTVLSGDAFGFQVMNSTTPDAFSFTAQSDVEPDGTVYPSNIIMISGITEAVTASVSDLGTGGAPEISVNGGLYTSSPVQVNDGDSLRVSILPDTNVFSAAYQAEVTIGGGSATFQVTTRAADTTPDSFVNYASLTNKEPSTVIASGDQTITGLEASASVSVSGAGSPQISLDGGSTWVASGNVANNGTVAVRLTSGTFGETRTATVSVGGVDGTFSVTTRSSNDNPVFADFTDELSAEPGVTVTSDAVTVTGIETTVTASVSGDGLPEIQVNGGAWTPAGNNVTVANNDMIAVRLTSGTFGETRTATADVNGVTQDFAVTTRAGDTTPDAFTIAAVTDAAPNSLEQSSTTINGIETAATVTVAGEGAPEFSTDGGSTWVDTNGSGTVSNGGTVLVRLTSGAFDATRTATLTVGGVDGTFSVTTGSQDTTPDVFAFATNLVAPSTADVESEAVTLAGFDGSVAISVSGALSAEYRIGTNSGSVSWDAWTSDAGTVSVGQLVQVRLDASASEVGSVSATLQVGTGSATYQVDSQDLTPDAYAFSAVTGASLNVVTTSDAVQVAGITGDVSVSVSAGNGALFRVGTGPDADNIDWGPDGFVDSTVTTVTVTNEGWVQMRLTSSASYETEVTGALTIGNGTPVSFSVTTAAEPVAVTLSSGAIPDGEQDTAYGGFDFTTLASVSGGPAGSPPTVNDLSWSVTGGALPAGMSLSSTGDLTGTPTEIGSFSFTVQAELNGQTDSASYTIIVNDPDGSLVVEGG